MNPVETGILGFYFLCMGLLAIYGFHRLYLVFLYRRHRNDRPLPPAELPGLPVLTVQIPLFNEACVAERIIDAACALDYPSGRLEIQVLDDSTDETAEICRRKVEEQAARGVRIRHIRRESREGFKAGALEAGLRQAAGEFVAIFDADFIPSPDFLRKTVPYFLDERVGLVQARWGHVNADYSVLTKVQAILLDAHFVLEHGGRNRAGHFFNFNGTAGIWRREVIPAAGGWQHDTLTEDLDLSYRAQLLGWKFIFLPDLVAPAEVPVEMNAFKSQQHRWAKGSIQVCLKLLPRILRSDQPFGVKAEAFLHLSANFNYLLMSALSILMFPAMVIRYNMGWYEMLLIDVPLFFAATASVANFYVVSQRELYPDWKARLRYIPFLMAVGIGLAVNNTRAVVEALLHHQTAFARTPKYGIERGSDQWVGKKYMQAEIVQPLVEIALGVYFTATVFYALANGIYGSLPFLVLFQAGFLYMGLMSVIQQFSGGQAVLNTQVARGK
jgi:cellulose synthase/poly-beta-1,6-N-acetylglucosamine synthase-like glycosyltransferase